MIEFHNPEAKVGIDEVPYDLALEVAGETVEIGLLANGFPDSEPFLEHLGEAMRRLEPGIAVTNFNKGNATVPAEDGLLQDVTARCAGVVAAYGH